MIFVGNIGNVDGQQFPSYVCTDRTFAFTSFRRDGNPRFNSLQLSQRIEDLLIVPVHFDTFP